MTGHADHEGQLVLADRQLIAILVRLDDEVHGEDRGLWFLEAGFGRVAHPNAPKFDSLDEAQTWIARRLASTLVLG